MFDKLINEIGFSNEQLTEIGDLCQSLIPYYTAEELELAILEAINEVLEQN